MELQKSKIFFTSDTHFSQERTRKFSERPFKSTDEMDNVLCKRWNDKISNNDFVYHLGDFGNPEILKYLNGYRIYLIPGNYDSSDVLSLLKQDKRVKVLDSGIDDLSITRPYITVKIKNQNVPLFMVHEPVKIVPGEFHLFGHVHKLQMIKSNALNVGVDCHNYSPISLGQVLKYRHLIQFVFDVNVFV